MHRLWHQMQAWLVVLLLITARSQAPLLIAGGVVLVTVLALPPRLWKPQLKRLGLLALFLFVSTAVFAGDRPAAPRSSLLGAFGAGQASTIHRIVMP